MSIKTTNYITRGVAESRILDILDLIQNSEWKALRKI